MAPQPEQVWVEKRSLTSRYTTFRAIALYSRRCLRVAQPASFTDFDADALDRLKNAFSTVCGAFEATLDKFNGEQDHVHLLIQYPPKVSISALVNSLKGVSARRLRQDRSDMARRYWRGGLWSASYFAASCGGAPIEVLRQYIEQQYAPE